MPSRTTIAPAIRTSSALVPRRAFIGRQEHARRKSACIARPHRDGGADGDRCGRVWHSRIPLDVRVEIDNARFAQLKERPQEPFTAAQDLLIATPALIAASIPLKELHTVMDQRRRRASASRRHRRLPAARSGRRFDDDHELRFERDCECERSRFDRRVDPRVRTCRRIAAGRRWP